MNRCTRYLRILAILCTLSSCGLGWLIPGALAANTTSITADTGVLLSGPGITLILGSGSTLIGYSVDTATLTLNLDSSSNVTVKSNNLYTLTNSLNSPTLCSASPAYSYVSFTAASPMAVTVTPSLTVACSNTAPVISSFVAAPSAITSGQSSTLSWSLSGASAVSIDNGVGSQSNATSSSVSVTPHATTTYTLAAVNYLGTTTAQTAVNVTAPSGGGGGGGGGGSIISSPVINAFSAVPSTIQPGQSSSLTWTVTGASSVSITPTVGTTNLSSLAGMVTITPGTSTTYTLTALNGYNQTVSATTTVNVLAGRLSLPPTPATQPPTPAASSPIPSSAPAYCLVNRSGTFYLILSGIRHGIANPGLLFSYGYAFPDAITDTAAYEALPSGDLLGPAGGALVKAPTNQTVYVVSDGTRHGFTSAKVFTELGYRFSSVLTIPADQLSAVPNGSLVSSATSRHLPGADISGKGTVYYLDDSGRYPYPSLPVFNTWHLHNDFSSVLPANGADLTLPLGPQVTPRSSCQ